MNLGLYRLQITLLFLAPLLALGLLYALGLSIPVPALGRNYVVRIALPDPGARMALPTISGPLDPTRPLVVIDAGHGGHDPGASGAGYREKAITLALARALRAELVRGGGVRVALTRNDDRFLVLGERAEIARQLGADLFLSIHADSAGEQEGVSGASIYTLSDMASSEAAARFAARENSADEVNGTSLARQDSGVTAILVELSQRRVQEKSTEFAALVLREGQVADGGEGGLQFHPVPVRSAGLAVLRAPDVPSALFEAGFITNPDDAGRLASAEGQARYAKVLAKAIRVYFARQAGL